MEGFGYVKNLPDSLKKKNEKYFIYQGNSVRDNDASGRLGKLDLLQPGNETSYFSFHPMSTFNKRSSKSCVLQRLLRLKQAGIDGI
ncbi:MAG: hypothetical protein K2X95_12075 [Flavobacteriaceae bacterium]|nr:hypothetical protein [Flavobacteriaceae bacterium]